MDDSSLQNVLNNIRTVLLNRYAFYHGMKAKNDFRYENFINASIELCIIQSDLLISCVKLNGNPSEIERKFFAKIIVVNLYEYLNNISSLLGKQLVEELEKLGFREFIENIYSLNKELNDIKKQNHKLFYSVRNNTIAHKALNKIELLEKNI